MLRIRLLGELSVEVDGRILERIASGRARALLAWLALHPGLHPRSRVASQFWPEILEESARASLRTTLTTLRHQLGEIAAGCIAADRERVGIEDTPGVWVDTREFARLVALRRGAEALELCRGELLSDLDDDWVLEERDRHRERVGQVLATLGATAEEAGDLHLAVRYSREHVALDPLSEDAARDLIRRLARTGDRAGAVASYRALRAALVRDLGIEPSAETRAIADEIQRDASPSAGAPRAPALPAALTRADAGPLVGRDDALAHLRQAWRQAGAGDAAMVTVAGEAGVGKTRLIAAFAVEAQREGAMTLAGRCFADGVAPYGPFAEALRQRLASAAPSSGWVATELARLLPELAPGHPDAGGDRDPQSARHRLFEAVAVVIAEAARERPLALVIEDLHWADRATLLMLAHVTRTVVWAPLLIVGSIRLGESVDDAALDTVLTDLRHDDRLDEIVLEGLSAGDVAELVSVRLGALTPSLPTELLHQRTGGNPLYVEEMIRHLGDRRPEPAGPRELLDAATWSVPSGVRALIDGRLARLGPPVRTIVGAAATAGEAFALDDVCAAADLSEDAAVEALDAAAAARLIEAEPTPGRFRFTHSLVRDAVLGALTPTRRALMHRRIADGIEARPGHPRLPDLARHLLDAHPLADRARTVTAVLRAAELSIRQLGYEDAAALLSRALDELEPAAAERAALMQALGDARARTGDSDGARQCFEEAARLASELGDAELFARAALGAAGLSIIIAPVREDVRALLAEAADVLEPMSPLRPEVLARLSVELYYEPAPIRGELSDEALIAGRRLGGRPLLRALIARHVALWSPDHPEERLAIADEIVATARANGDREAELEGMNWRVSDLLELGDMDAAHTAIETHARLAEELRLLAYVWYAPMWRAMLATLAERLDDAAILVDEGTRIGRLAHDENAAFLFDMQRLTIRAARGELAAPDWEDIQRLSARPSTPGGAWTAWLVVLLLGDGRTEEAARVLTEAVAGSAALPLDANWLYVVTTLGVGAAFLGDTAAAAQLYPRLLPYAGRIVVTGRGASCFGSAAYSLGMMASALRDDPAAAQHLADAVATDDRIGAAAFAAAARHALASVLERGGDHARAGTLRAESIAAGRRLGMTVPHDILRRF